MSKAKENLSQSVLSSTHIALKEARDMLHTAQGAVEIVHAKIKPAKSSLPQMPWFDDDCNDDVALCVKALEDSGAYLKIALDHINEHRGKVLYRLEDLDA